MLLLPFLVEAQNTKNADFCISRTAHSPITASSNTTIRGDSINCNGSTTSAITIPDGTSNVHITKCWLGNTTSLKGVIYVGHNCTNIVIDTCYITTGYYGVDIGGGNVASTGNGLHINYSRIINIQDGTSRPTGGGCSVQLNMITGTGIQVNNNDVYFAGLSLYVGDVLSFFKSNGTSSSPIQCNGNCIEGGSSDPSGKAAIILGDQGGSWQQAYNNKIKNTGYAGIQVQGGSNIDASNNQIYGAKSVISLLGITYRNVAGGSSTNITMGGSKINWTNSSGSIVNKFIASGQTVPTGWLTNTADHVADPTINASLLPDPLWTSCSVVVSPPVISYIPSANVYTAGTTIGTLTPTNTGGSAVSYSVSPAFPAGVTLNTTTGVISGTPTVATPLAAYIVTATNTGGSGTFKLTITVNGTPILPPVFTYSPSINVYSVGQGAITPISPISTGGAVVSYTVTPTLPASLSMNTGTGIISGTPTAISPNTTYTITGTNTGGSGKATLSIQINPNPIVIPNITYSPDTVAVVYGYLIVPMPPINTGGTGTYTISPSLPSGMSISSTTGVISGTPLAVQGQLSYTVSCTNASGTGMHTVKIRITKAHLTITANSQTKFQGQPNPPLTVTYAGFVASDTPTNGLTTLPTVTTTAVTGSPIGAYTISASGAVAGNYVISYANGTLVVELPTSPIYFRYFGGIITN